MHLSARSMFADFEPLIGELHEGAGVGLATAYNMSTGIKVNSRAAAEYLKLGMWDRSKVVFNKLGGVKSTVGNPLNTKAADLLAHDPVEFYRQIVLPAYQRAGITKSEDITHENAKLFGGTGGKLFNLMDKQIPLILKSRESYKKTQNIDQAEKTTNGTYAGKVNQLKAAGKDFLTVAATKGGLLDNMTSLLTTATSALKGFTAWGEAHPTAFSWLGKILVDLLLMKAGLSIAKIAFGGLLGPVAQVYDVWSKLRIAGGFADAFPRIARGAGLLRTAFLMLGRGAMQAGVMMLANPMVLTIVAIVAAAGLLGVAAYEIYQHWSSVSHFFSGLWSGIRSVFSISLRDIGKRVAFFTGYALGTLWRFGGRAYGWLTGTLPGLLVRGWNFAWNAVGVALGALGGLLVRAWHFAWHAFGTALHAAFVTLPLMFADFGVMIVTGLWNGIKSAPGRLWSAGAKLAGSVAAGFRAGAKINSPSRLFHSYGSFLTQGLHNGIDKGTHAPVRRMRRLAGELASAIAVGGGVEAMPSMAATIAQGGAASAARAAGAGTPAAVYHIELHVHQQPGEDGRLFAKRVVRAMKDHDRGLRNSSYGDHE